jgi:hypothetical protein
MAPDCEPARSRHSSSAGGSDCDDAMADAPSTRLSTPSRTEEAIRTLQHTVQKLEDQIEALAPDKAPDRPQASYVATAGAGVSKRPVILPTPRYKHVPTRHKREIIVVRGTKTKP